MLKLLLSPQAAFALPVCRLPSPAAGGCPSCPCIHGPQAAGPVLSAAAGRVDRSKGRLCHGGRHWVGRYQRRGPSCKAEQEQRWAWQPAGELSHWCSLQSFSHQ